MSDVKAVTNFDIHDGRLIEIGCPDDIDRFVRGELDEWGKLQETTQQFAQFLQKRYEQMMREFANVANAWRESIKHNAQFDVRGAIGPVFSRLYDGKQIIHCKSPIWAFLVKTREELGPISALAAYSYLVNCSVQVDHSTIAKTVEGFVKGMGFQGGADWDMNAYKLRIQPIVEQLGEVALKQQRRFADIESANVHLNERFDHELSERGEALRKLHSDQAEEFRRQLTSHVEQLKQIEMTYDKKLALQKPVEYWEAKRGSHRWRAWVFGVLAAVSSCGIGYCLYLLVKHLLGKGTGGPSTDHFQIAVLALAAFGAIWFLRVLVRLFLSHTHLAVDADERCTMVLTYLAMSREGSPFEAADRSVILNNLFRSASDGLVRDDAAPPTPLETLSRAK